MRAFTRVVYGIIDVQLQSSLHIGTGSDSIESDIAQDSEGAYILPATAIAGVSLHYIRDLQDDETGAALDLLGNPLHPRQNVRQESRVYYYDAICQDVQIEQRTGVGMDHARGTAMEGRLFKGYFISPGMKASIQLQIFAADEREAATAKWLIEHIAQGYHSGKIAMGKRTSSGAGRFAVTGIKTYTLDLTSADDRAQYLSGVEACLAAAAQQGSDIPVSSIMQSHTDRIDSYTLTAYCPQGLIVRSGEQLPRTQGERVDNVTVNMFYTMPQELDSDEEPELHYYIPGTSIKGVLRTYAERVYSVMGLNPSEMDYLFGPSPDSDARPRKSCIRTFDTDLQGAVPRMHNRIKLDRVLGSVMEGAMMEEELLYISKEHSFDLQVMMDYNTLSDLEGKKDVPDPELLRQHAEAVIFLAMRDLGTGRVTLGSGSSIGHGRLQGVTLKCNENVFDITGEAIDCGQGAGEIRQILASLGGGAQ